MGRSVAGFRGTSSTPSTRSLRRSRITEASPPVTSSPARLFASCLLGTIIIAATLLAGQSAVAAPLPAPPDLPQSTTTPPPTEQPLAITSPASGSFSGSSTVRVTGTKAAGAQVQILAGPSRQDACIVQSDASTSFECNANVPSGPDVALVAVEIDPENGDRRESEPVIVDVLAPPSIDGGDGQLTAGFVSGRGYPGAQVTLTASTGNSWTFSVPQSGQWSHGGPRELPNGRHSLTATQASEFSGSNSSDRSAAVTIDLDKEPPPAPTVTSPAAGATMNVGPVTIAGRGEPRAGLTVYVYAADSSPQLACTTTVSAGGTWECQAQIAVTGRVSISAFQQDEAGNPGPLSGETTITVNRAAGQPSNPNTPPPSATTEPTPSPDATEESPEEAPEPAPPGTSPAPPPSGDEPPSAFPPPGPWAERTPFTTAVPSAFGGTDELSWPRAALLAAASIALLLIPARMLATTIGASRSPSTSRFTLTGRNRDRVDAGPVEPLRASTRTLIGALAVAAASAVVMFAHPIQGQPAYLRLYGAAFISVLLVNLVAAIVPAFIAWVRTRAPLEIVVAPRYLVAIVATAIVSRMLGLEPALLFGLVLAVGFVVRDDGDSSAAVTPSRRAVLALARIGTLFGLGLVGWSVSTSIPDPMGFWPVFATEVANITTVIAIGSATVLLVPLGRTSGRAILSWSWPVWLTASFFALTVLFALLSPSLDRLQASGDGLGLIVGAVLFGAIGAATWIWRRFIAAQLS